MLWRVLRDLRVTEYLPAATRTPLQGVGVDAAPMTDLTMLPLSQQTLGVAQTAAIAAQV